MKRKNARFRVQRFLFETQTTEPVCRYMLTDREIPMLIPNQYIENMSMRKASNGRIHAVKLCCFFNYLHESQNTEYENASNIHVKHFLNSLIYAESDFKILFPTERLSYSTLSGYVSVITEFYRWLDMNYSSYMTFFEGERRCRVQSYLYGQIYSQKYKTVINRILPDAKGGREYIKWYTEEEKSRICGSFKTLRDEAVFRLTLEGFRIDEALSITLSSYDPFKMTAKPTRSKRKPSVVPGGANKLRLVRLNEETCRIIDRYLFEERTPAENESGRISEVMFLNLAHGEYMGLPLTYFNFRKILRSAGERVGLAPERIRTHSGRSTRVMEVLEADAQHPECVHSELQIQQLFGWADINSIQPYRNTNSEIMAHSAAMRRKSGADND